MESKHSEDRLPEGTQGRAPEHEAGLETCTLLIDQEPPRIQGQTQALQVSVSLKADPRAPPSQGLEQFWRVKAPREGEGLTLALQDGEM